MYPPDRVHTLESTPSPKPIVVLIAGDTAAIRLPTSDDIGMWRIAPRAKSIETAYKKADEHNVAVRVEYLNRHQFIERILR